MKSFWSIVLAGAAILTSSSRSFATGCNLVVTDSRTSGETTYYWDSKESASGALNYRKEIKIGSKTLNASAAMTTSLASIYLTVINEFGRRSTSSGQGYFQPRASRNTISSVTASATIDENFEALIACGPEFHRDGYRL